jgi:hypothetical protein
MWYHPAAYSVTKKDVIAAWLVCSLIAVSFFVGTVVAAAELGDEQAAPRQIDGKMVDPARHVAERDLALECQRVGRGGHGRTLLTGHQHAGDEHETGTGSESPTPNMRRPTRLKYRHACTITETA